MAHKSDVGGVRVGVAPRMWRHVCQDLRAAGRALSALEGWLVQEQVTGGTEMLLGVIRDAQLGLAVVLGAGGIATEVFGDTAVRLLPLGPDRRARHAGRAEVPGAARGLSGQPPGDVDALVDAIERFAAMAVALGDRLLEAEINPLFVLPRGQGVLAADGLVVLAEEPAPSVEAAAEAAAEARRDSTGSKLAAT